MDSPPRLTVSMCMHRRAPFTNGRAGISIMSILEVTEDAAHDSIALGHSSKFKTSNNRNKEHKERCAEMCGAFFLFGQLENGCTPVIRSNRQRLQVMHVGIRKHRQATDSTRKPRPATPPIPFAPTSDDRLIKNLTTQAILTRATARAAPAGLLPGVTLHT